MRSVYYIIPTAGIGGAEKRFVELWCYLQQNEKQFDFNLIISTQLHAALKDNEVLYNTLRSYEKKIQVYKIDFDLPVIKFQKELYSFVCQHTTPKDILHFILSFPTFVFPLKHNKTVYSLTESSLSNVNIKGKLLYLMNIYRAAYSDILDPIVHKKVSRYFFLKKNRIRLTPGSFVDVSVYKPVPEKENWFVFLGRFFWVKQVIELLRTLPEVCQRIETSGLDVQHYKFIFIGYAQLENEIKTLVEQPEYKMLPIEITKTNRPEEILSKSKVFFSVQLKNNYPSKSLLEGIAAGNIPLVTDVGTTRMIAAPEFSYYVPEHFSATDIADQLIAILSLDEAALKQKMQAARNFVEHNFSIQASASYYTGLYNNL